MCHDKSRAISHLYIACGEYMHPEFFSDYHAQLLLAAKTKELVWHRAVGKSGENQNHHTVSLYHYFKLSSITAMPVILIV